MDLSIFQGDSTLLGTRLAFLQEFEKDLLKLSEVKQPLAGRINIAIGGTSGVGKDTLAISLQKLFKQKLGISLKIIVAGEVLRQLARENGYHESDLDIYMKKITKEKKAEDVDRKIEQETLRKALTTNGGIYVGRMAPFTIGDWGFTIWLKADRESIAFRVVNDRKRSEFGLDEKEVLKKLQYRDELDFARLEHVYNVDLSKLIPSVNLILDSTELDKVETAERAYSESVLWLKENELLGGCEDVLGLR